MSTVLAAGAGSRANDVTAAAWRGLLGSAGDRYRSAGRFAWRSASGKLRFDPVFRHIVATGLVAPRDRLLDIGCGRGLLLSLLAAAEDAAAGGGWPASWPPAPAGVRMTGIELMAGDADAARAALAGRAAVICGDMCETPLPPADVVALLDVLHYVDIEAQDRLLVRVREALRPGGRLLLRVGDAARQGAFRNSQWVDRIVLLLRGQRRRPMFGRPLAAWQQRLESLGFAAVETRPMSRGTAFANVLLVARLGAAGDHGNRPEPAIPADDASGSDGGEGPSAASPADAGTSRQ